MIIRDDKGWSTRDGNSATHILLWLLCCGQVQKLELNLLCEMQVVMRHNSSALKGASGCCTLTGPLRHLDYEHLIFLLLYIYKFSRQCSLENISLLLTLDNCEVVYSARKALACVWSRTAKISLKRLSHLTLD